MPNGRNPCMAAQGQPYETHHTTHKQVQLPCDVACYVQEELASQLVKRPTIFKTALNILL